MVDVGLGLEEETDPAAVWQNMMPLSLAGAHKLISDGLGERDIDQVVPVNVS
jgi:hypothetical protein